MTTKRKLRRRKPEMPNLPNDRYAGRAAGVFGLRGELKCDPTTAGRTVFFPGAALRWQRADAGGDLTIEAVREHQGRFLLRFRGVTDATAAGKYVGADFYAPREAFVLEEGEYLDEDLVGCELFDARSKPLGTVTALEHYPGQDLLVVNGQRVPMVAQFIKSIELTAKRIVVDLPRGLLDPEEAEEA